MFKCHSTPIKEIVLVCGNCLSTNNMLVIHKSLRMRLFPLLSWIWKECFWSRRNAFCDLEGFFFYISEVCIKGFQGLTKKQKNHFEKFKLTLEPFVGKWTKKKEENSVKNYNFKKFIKIQGPLFKSISKLVVISFSKFKGEDQKIKLTLNKIYK